MTSNTHADGSVSIGELSRRTGVPVRTIRFYCDEGVLESHRSTGGHRLFDPATSVGRLNLVRRLRTFGLGLPAIMSVLAGSVSIADAVAVERAALDRELDALTWRRAVLMAVEDAVPAQRAVSVELLAAVGDRAAAHESLIAFWRRVLASTTPEIFDAFVAMNIPAPPVDPTPRQVLAYARLATAVTDPALTTAIRAQLWRHDATGIRAERTLLAGVAEACEAVGPLLVAGIEPRPGPELDLFVTAHADARGCRPTAEFRHRLLCEGDDNNPRIHRYWRLTAELLGTPTGGAAQDWLYRALRGCTAGATL
ncbi:MerR family transcriptional regulator [Nocardia vermiculata]|uniref:MerR family transcriptional regulator n=1 Tax=Nocardia vermiculata TaxID=257274 RepID=A0A846Y025_9NOCA|nr:MerR family transcriptional regulator [Nocardia vermiculata]NKY51442.1 MerR family transcriptional regulator [Nocardia vermiculata]